MVLNQKSAAQCHPGHIPQSKPGLWKLTSLPLYSTGSNRWEPKCGDYCFSPFHPDWCSGGYHPWFWCCCDATVMEQAVLGSTGVLSTSRSLPTTPIVGLEHVAGHRVFHSTRALTDGCRCAWEGKISSSAVWLICKRTQLCVSALNEVTHTSASIYQRWLMEKAL